MDKKMNTGDQFPSIVLNIGKDQTIAVPEDLDSKYTMLLIYRGH